MSNERRYLAEALAWAVAVATIVTLQAMLMTWFVHHRPDIAWTVDIPFVITWLAMFGVIVPHVYHLLRRAAGEEDPPRASRSSRTAGRSSNVSRRNTPEH